MLHLGRSQRGVPQPGGLVLIGILLALLLVMVVVGVARGFRRARASRRIIDAPAGEPELTSYGGIMCQGLMTSGSLVRLDLLDWGVRLRGTPLARWLVPQWEARYEELAIAELVRTPYSRIMVWFRLQGQPGGIGFMTTQHRDILDKLQQHEVPVNRSVQQIRSPADMYGEMR
jgi:hypothetical protein